MISEEEKIRLEDAKSCNDCLSWHKHCKAECCKMILLNGINPSVLEESGNFIMVRRILTANERWYYRLHGIGIIHGSLRIDKSLCLNINGELYYIRKCDLLDGENKCKGHPDNKPQICRMLTEHNLDECRKKGLIVTDNCLFKYKEGLNEGKS